MTGKKGQCGKVIGVVDKRIIALMRNDEVYEMEVANIGCDKHTKCLPELDSGTFLKFCFVNERKAPGQARCDGKEGAVRKGDERCG